MHTQCYRQGNWPDQDRGSETGDKTRLKSGRAETENFPPRVLVLFSHPPHPNRLSNRAYLTDSAETDQILREQVRGSKKDRGMCAQDVHTARKWAVADSPRHMGECQRF